MRRSTHVHSCQSACIVGKFTIAAGAVCVTRSHQSADLLGVLSGVCDADRYCLPDCQASRARLQNFGLRWLVSVCNQGRLQILEAQIPDSQVGKGSDNRAISGNLTCRSEDRKGACEKNDQGRHRPFCQKKTGSADENSSKRGYISDNRVGLVCREKGGLESKLLSPSGSDIGSGCVPHNRGAKYFRDYSAAGTSDNTGHRKAGFNGHCQNGSNSHVRRLYPRNRIRPLHDRSSCDGKTSSSVLYPETCRGPISNRRRTDLSTTGRAIAEHSGNDQIDVTVSSIDGCQIKRSPLGRTPRICRSTRVKSDLDNPGCKNETDQKQKEQSSLRFFGPALKTGGRNRLSGDVNTGKEWLVIPIREDVGFKLFRSDTFSCLPKSKHRFEISSSWLASYLFNHHERKGGEGRSRFGSANYRHDARSHDQHCRSHLQSGGIYGPSSRNRAGMGRPVDRWSRSSVRPTSKIATFNSVIGGVA